MSTKLKARADEVSEICQRDIPLESKVTLYNSLFDDRKKLKDNIFYVDSAIGMNYLLNIDRYELDSDDFNALYDYLLNELEAKKSLSKKELTAVYDITNYHVFTRFNDYNFDNSSDKSTDDSIRASKILSLLQSRDMTADLALITGYEKDQICFTKEDALSGGFKYYHGNLFLENISSVTGLKLPESIGGSLNLDNLTSLEGLALPKNIGGELSLFHLTSTDGLVLPENIGWNLDLSHLTTANGLRFPKRLNGLLYLSSLISAEGLILPELIRWNLTLDSLVSAEGLTLPKHIGGDISLNSLTSIKGLRLPESFTGHLYLKFISTADKDILRHKYPKAIIF
jgi:hypothetical protein